MSRGRDTKKRKRAARLALEALEDRVELSGAGAVAGYVTAVDRLNGALHAQVEAINAHILQRAAQLDQGYQAAISDAAGLAGGVAARQRLTRTTARMDRLFDSLVRNTDRRVNAFSRRIDAQIAHLSNHYGGLDLAIWSAVPAAETQFRNGAGALGAALEGEARAARDAAQGAGASARAAVTRAHRAAGQASLASVMSTYDRTFNALQAELMRLPANLSISVTGTGNSGAGRGLGATSLHGATTARLGGTTGTGLNRPSTGAGVGAGTGTTGTPVSTGTTATGSFVGSGASRVGIGTGTTGVGRSIGTGTGTGAGYDATGLGGTGTYTGTGSYLGTGAASVGIGTGSTPTGTGVSTGAGTGLGGTGVGLGSSGNGLGHITGTMTGNGAVTTGTLTTGSTGPVTGTATVATTDYGIPSAGATGLGATGLSGAYSTP